MSFSKQTVLITGASSGIGFELAKLFAADGYDLMLVSRSEKALDDLAFDLQTKHGIDAKVIAKDLSRIESCRELYDECVQCGICVDILVNNAGFGGWGHYWETDLDREMQMMNLNMLAPVHLTKLFLKGMVQRKKGRILNVASTAAFQPGPLMAIYYATKAFVLSFSEAIATELEGTGVTVTALCPGPTETNFRAAAGMEKSMLFSKHLKMDAPSVARIGYEDLMKGKVLSVPGLKNRIVMQSLRLAPRSFIRASVKKMQEARREL